MMAASTQREENTAPKRNEVTGGVERKDSLDALDMEASQYCSSGVVAMPEGVRIRCRSNVPGSSVELAERFVAPPAGSTELPDTDSAVASVDFLGKCVYSAVMALQWRAHKKHRRYTRAKLLKEAP